MSMKDYIYGNIFTLTSFGIEIDRDRECKLRSIPEIELYDFVNSLHPCEHSIRINMKELDIVLSGMNFGVEFNGVYWHSSAVDKFIPSYHADKVNHMRDHGYTYIQIWEDDWRFKKDVVKQYINNLLSQEQIIDPEVRLIDSSIYLEFMDHNWFHDLFDCDVCYGLYDGNRLVACAGVTVGDDIEIMNFTSLYDSRFAFSEILGAISNDFDGRSMKIVLDLELHDRYDNFATVNGFVEIGQIDIDYKVLIGGADMRVNKEDVVDSDKKYFLCYDSGKIIYRR